jgi:hypothetical protein
MMEMAESFQHAKQASNDELEGLKESYNALMIRVGVGTLM